MIKREKKTIKGFNFLVFMFIVFCYNFYFLFESLRRDEEETNLIIKEAKI